MLSLSPTKRLHCSLATKIIWSACIKKLQWLAIWPAAVPVTPVHVLWKQENSPTPEAVILLCLMALMAAPRHELCLVHVWTHRWAQSFKTEIDTNSYASPDSWAALGYAMYNSQVYHNPGTEATVLNQTDVIQIKVNNNPQMGVACGFGDVCM